MLQQQEGLLTISSLAGTLASQCKDPEKLFSAFSVNAGT
jgi:hypothetical protein